MQNDDDNRLQRLEDGQDDVRERLVILETKTNDIHGWLAPKNGRPTIPERMVKVEIRQAGLIWTTCAAITAALAVAGAWLAAKLGA